MQVEEERDGTGRQRYRSSQCYLSTLEMKKSMGEGLSWGARAKPDPELKQLTSRTGKLPLAPTAPLFPYC